jgi:hypothetical protein
MTASELRRELSARNLVRAEGISHEVTFGHVPSVIYAEAEEGKRHGNFVPASWRRIQADPGWARRLEKVYTAGGRVARRHDRWRGELECANSSDALLMNVFCYPGVTSSPALCGMLGLEPGLRPEFGVRIGAPLGSGRVDRTEVDMVLGEYLVEAKLTETGFGTARTALVERYRDLEEVFEVEELPRSTETGAFTEYQLVRGVLGAHSLGARFLLICDGRRLDLAEGWFRVMRAVKPWELKTRLRMVTWQELAGAVPRGLREFLGEKYGIVS